MAALWTQYKKSNKASLVDWGWAFSFTMSAIFCFLALDGHTARKLIMTLMFTIWSLRLSSYLLLNRIISHEDDPRYEALKEKWGSKAHKKFFFFFQFQAMSVAVLSLPLVVVSFNPDTRLTWMELIGVILWFVAMMGETLADKQLSDFKSDPANRGKTCNEGLWRYSRHPNYFFEWLVWVSYSVYAFWSPYGYISIISPLLMLYFLLRVTGIPATEEQALKSRGDDYRNYQQKTSAFIPWFPKA